MNAGLAIAIVVIIAIAPIPLGSNRPAFWMMWSSVVGLLALAYGAALLWLGAPARFGLKRLWPELAASALLCIFVVCQILPVGRWLPEDFVSIPALGVRLPQLSFDAGNSQLVLIQFTTFGLLFLLAAQVAVNRSRARRMLFTILLLIAAFAMFGLVSLTQFGDTLLGFDKQFYRGNATGTFVNRNSFAAFLSVGLAVGITLLMQTLVERREYTMSRLLGYGGLIAVSLVFISAALAATGSRLGMLAAVIGVVVAIGLSAVSPRASPRVAMVAVAMVGLAAVAAVAFFGEQLVERLVLLGGDDESRLEAHRQIWEAIMKRPWTGYGAGSFASVFPMFQRPPLSGEYIWEYAHSTYLALWFELGLVAGTLPLILTAMLGFRALLAIRNTSSTTTSVAAVSTIAVFATHSLLDFPAEIEANAFLFTVILALGAAGAIGPHTRVSRN